MQNQFKNQAEQFFNAAKDARIPENLQAFAVDSVAKSRDAFEKLSGAAKDQAKVAEDVLLASQAGAKVISSKMVDNTVNNAAAAFDAAHAIAQARSVPEAVRLQTEFMQKQLAIASAQTKELFELSTQIARQAFESVNVSATKSFEQMKKGA